MRVRVVLGVALALVGVAVVVALSQRAPRLAGTSFVVQRGPVAAVPAHAIACQPGTYVPDDSAAAQVVAYPSGPGPLALAVTFRDPDGALVAHGAARDARASGGDVTVPLTQVVNGNHANATACVRNLGSEGFALSGDVASPGAAARVDGRATGGVVGFRYFRAGRQSWWSLMPVVAQRFGLGKSRAFGTWTLPLLALVLLGLWVAAARLLLRGEES